VSDTKLCSGGLERLVSDTTSWCQTPSIERTVRSMPVAS